MQRLPLFDHRERADEEGLISLMPQRERSTAPVVKFSRCSVSRAKSLLNEQNMQHAKVVTLRGCSTASAKPTSSAANRSPNLDPPLYLVDEIAIREWLTVAPALLRRGLLDETMKPLLAGYCNALARSVRAEQVLSKEGRYYKTVTRGGSTIKRRHPAVQDAEEGWASVRHFAKQLGISSSPARQVTARVPDINMFK